MEDKITVMIAIRNARLVLEDRILEKGVVLIDNGMIYDFGEEGTVAIPADAEVYDAEGRYVGPGFVDIHVHGGGGHMLYRNPLGAAAHFLRCGTTTVLATTYTDMDTDEMVAAIDRVKEARASGGIGAALGGIYMEAPYMNPKYGAQPEKNKWRGAVDPVAYTPFVKAGGSLVKVWAIAPEREGLLPFILDAKRANPSVVFSVAHSEATPDQVSALKPYGIRLQTHCMNATGRMPTAKGTRSCGPDEACFLDDDMYAEVICDSQGIHVHPDMLRLILKIKGKDKVVLISDSFVSDEPNPPSLAHVTDLCFDANGGLCGSKLTLNVACRNLRKHVGCSIVDAFLMASRNPARVIGMDDTVGTIAIGKRANLVVVDDDFNIERVMLDGCYY